MRKFEIALLAGLIIALILTPLTGFASECAQVRAGVVRLHILANSDTAADQALKLAVRDKLLTDDDNVFLHAATTQEALRLAQASLSSIEQTARAEVLAQGYNYPVKAQLVEMPFTTRQYGDTILPAGRYHALRITIGEGAGQNWWCVMYPPMCVPAAKKTEKTQDEATIDELNTKPAYKMGFATVELVQKLSEFLGLDNG